jgi:hypothetical protein
MIGAESEAVKRDEYLVGGVNCNRQHFHKKRGGA